MGNQNGLLESMMNISMGIGSSKKHFDGGYFSMAHGDEIALVLEEKQGFFILNFDDDLWEKTQAKVDELNGNSKKLISWWKKMSKEYEISVWSSDFSELLTKGETK